MISLGLLWPILIAFCLQKRKRITKVISCQISKTKRDHLSAFELSRKKIVSSFSPTIKVSEVGFHRCNSPLLGKISKKARFYFIKHSTRYKGAVLWNLDYFKDSCKTLVLFKAISQKRAI